MKETQFLYLSELKAYFLLLFNMAALRLSNIFSIYKDLCIFQFPVFQKSWRRQIYQINIWKRYKHFVGIAVGRLRLLPIPQASQYRLAQVASTKRKPSGFCGENIRMIIRLTAFIKS
jgi:hypothetical protein